MISTLYSLKISFKLFLNDFSPKLLRRNKLEENTSAYVKLKLDIISKIFICVDLENL